MLKNNDREKLEQYIDKLIKGIYLNAKKDIQSGMPEKQIIEKILNVTINKITPEGKMILSSTYNMLMEQTLGKQLYQNPQNKSAFYEMDILKQLNKKFNFEIPKNINYEESENEINVWAKAGAVVISGGIISIPLNSYVPVGIAVIIAGIMAYLLKGTSVEGKQNVDALIKEYLHDVKNSMLLWINSVEKYYDERVAELERKLVE